MSAQRQFPALDSIGRALPRHGAVRSDDVALKVLKPIHKQLASLLAQGVSRDVICELLEFNEKYIATLMRDPLFREYQKEISEFVDARIEGMFGKVADAIQDGLTVGTVDERLKAGRLQLELTKRLGSGTGLSKDVESSVERLNTLAERLLALNNRTGRTYNGEVNVETVQQVHSEQE